MIFRFVRKIAIISDMERGSERSIGSTERIREYLERIPEGQVFTSAELMAFGSRTAIDQAISRFVKSGWISRVARGVFVRPKENRFVGKVPPPAAEVAQAIAKTQGDRIEVHGAEAARFFGLTTQVPVKPMFNTTGPARRIRMENLEVVLQHKRPRKLALAGRPAGVALAALWYLGKENTTSEVIELIRQKLSPVEFGALVEAIPTMPIWMAKLFYQYRKRASE